MKKAFSVGAIFVFLFCFTVRAFPWGSATHAYIIDQFMRKAGPPRLMYGAMAPDVFNYFFENITLRDQLYAMTHFDFMKLWNASKGPSDRPSAYGFVSHNNEWGADSTAHLKSLTFMPNEGFVITKAKILWDLIKSAFPFSDELGVSVCHDVIEAAVDLQIKTLDPNIGNRLVDSARSSDKKLLELLNKAYLADVTMLVGSEALAQYLIAQNETGFRYAVLQLGNALKLKSPNDLNAIAAIFAALGQQAYGIEVPPAVVAAVLELAMWVCTDPLFGPDCFTEIYATIDYVRLNLNAHGIFY